MKISSVKVKPTPKEDSMIKKPETIQPRLTGILWGPPKSGKTTLLMSMPGNKLIVNVDPDGPNSVYGRDDYSLLDISDMDDKACCEFTTKGELSTEIMNSDFGEGDSLIFDSLSSYGQRALVTAINNKVGQSPGFTPSIEAPGLAAYGARTQYIVSTVRNVLKATARKKMHCFFTSHEDTPTTDKAGNFLYQTMYMSDNAINQTSLSISEVWYIFQDNKVRRIMVAPGRGKKPMGSRMFTTIDDPEFIVKYDPLKPNTQPHSMETWWKEWLKVRPAKLPLPE